MNEFIDFGLGESRKSAHIKIIKDDVAVFWYASGSRNNFYLKEMWKLIGFSHAGILSQAYCTY